MSEEIKDVAQTNIDDEQAQVQAQVNSTDESLNTEETKETNVDTKIPYDRFKAKVDEANALKERLAEVERAQAEKERKELEEQNEYKTLYERALEDARLAKEETLGTKKGALLTQAGYTPEQVEVLRGTITGETDEELAKAVDGLKDVIAPKKNYIDPTPMGGGDGKPKPQGNEGLGKSLYERVMGKK